MSIGECPGCHKEKGRYVAVEVCMDCASKLVEAAPSASHNTTSDAIPLWAVREWLRRNVNSNLQYVESVIVSMVGIAEQRTS